MPQPVDKAIRNSKPASLEVSRLSTSSQLHIQPLRNTGLQITASFKRKPLLRSPGLSNETTPTSTLTEPGTPSDQASDNKQVSDNHARCPTCTLCGSVCNLGQRLSWCRYGHMFCKKCFEQCLSSDGICPASLCRHGLHDDDLAHEEQSRHTTTHPRDHKQRTRSLAFLQADLDNVLKGCTCSPDLDSYTCSLCREACIPMMGYPPAVGTSCHTFCGECALQWLATAKTCPVVRCNRNLGSAETIALTRLKRLVAVDRAMEKVPRRISPIVKAGGGKEIPYTESGVVEALHLAAKYLLEENDPILPNDVATIDLHVLGPHLIAMGNLLPAFNYYMDDSFTALQAQQWHDIVPALYGVFSAHEEQHSEVDAFVMYSFLAQNVERSLKHDVRASGFVADQEGHQTPGQKDLHRLFGYALHICKGVHQEQKDRIQVA